MIGKLARGWRRLGLSLQILVGLGLGVLLGLFIGEPAAQLQTLADIDIRLMQMTVLPYLITALVLAFGQLEPRQARRLAVLGGLMLLLVWALMALLISLLPLAFPDYVSAAFYSSSLVEPPREFSLAELYFTANPFESLSRNVVPAVVLFSSLFGIAVMRLRNKARLLEPLQVWNEAMVLITRMVIQLTPYGVFCIAAVTAGTMTAQTFLRLEVYFASFAACALLLTFVILPLLVCAVTPFRYRELLAVSRDALLTAFITQSAFIVLPLLTERVKELLARHERLGDRAESASEVLIPVLYNFPNAGKLLTLLFIPFAAWLAGTPLPAGDYAGLFAAGIPSYFAKAQVALPFLLDLLGLPHDLFMLYIPTTILTGNFDSMVAAMNLFGFALVGAAAMGGFLVLETARLLRAATIAALATAATLVLLRVLLAWSVHTGYDLDARALQMQLPADLPAAQVFAGTPEGDAGQGPVMQRIAARGTLRVGFEPDNLPFSFFNDAGELVGFDVELALRLAAGLGVRAEFVPIEWEAVPAMLARGEIDVMPGIWYRPNWFGKLHLSAPYMQGTVGFAVRDERRHEFASIEDLRRSQGLVIGIPLDRRQVQSSIERYFGDADVRFELVPFWKPFFEGEYPQLDAFLMPVEHASGWSLLHPDYTVVVPHPHPIRLSTAFGVARDAGELAGTINEWIVLAMDTGYVDQSYRYWVLGQGAQDAEPRWSIARDVLGWGRGR